eukprot:CAMPEP_0113827482 /NCGR_PEP_ID=MMETSP0328-20130328/4787_1 /TAXON_ID=39455 /ORGANISM="Alexandrium minutum" /LENGTH=187 /DNA_ID=CAMNT_0000795467 /DNA_START=79 /DNA_END=642 /DNA_ORIENTATION=+ /assembly_acc=CAM_ASM_000350
MALRRAGGRVLPCAVALAAVSTATTFLVAFTGPAQWLHGSSAGVRSPTARGAAAADVAADVRRRWLRADLESLADSLGIEVADANTTRSDLELLALVTAKVKTMEDSGKLAEVVEEKNAALERAAELETSLAEATQRADELGAGLKEISEIVEIGGFGGIFSMFMSEMDILKETKAKVAELKKVKGR